LVEKPFVTDIRVSGSLAGPIFYETALKQTDTKIFAPYPEGARRGFRYEEEGYSVYIYEDGEVRGTGTATSSEQALSIVNESVTRFTQQIKGPALKAGPRVEEVEVGKSVEVDPNILISDDLLGTLQKEYGENVKVKSVEILISPPKGLARIESITPIRPGDKKAGPVLLLCRAGTMEEAERALNSLENALGRREAT
jgi:hypothetical protein